MRSEDAHLVRIAIWQRLQLLLAEGGQSVQFQAVEYRQRQMVVERVRLSLRLAR